MSMSDPIADLLTRIRNAQERGKSKVSTPHSKLRVRAASPPWWMAMWHHAPSCSS